MHTTLSRSTRALAALALVFTAAACGDSSGPKTTDTIPLDAATVADKQLEVNAVANQPIFRQLVGQSFSASVRAGTSVQRVQLSALAGIGGKQVDAQAVRGALQSLAPRREFIPGEAIVPAEIRGITFVYGDFGWKVDSLNGQPRAGAPTNGVRFILNRIDEASGMPTAERLGHLDLIDLSSGNTLRYTTRVTTTAGLVVLESTTSIGGTSEMDMTISQSGFITDGTRRVNQVISVTQTRLSYHYSAPFAGFEYGLTFAGNPETGSFTAEINMTADGTRVRFVMNAGQTTMLGKVYVNGALFAQFSASGDSESADWTKADGRTPLDADDVETLMLIFGAFDSFPDLEWMDSTVSWWVSDVSGGGF